MSLISYIDLKNILERERKNTNERQTEREKIRMKDRQRERENTNERQREREKIRMTDRQTERERYKNMNDRQTEIERYENMNDRQRDVHIYDVRICITYYQTLLIKC